ncbi:hypothetical protein DFJ43DRAFT_1044717 [Lentinula guzmanii]|uniref:Helicase ATP-binding domain-containing protein n=1 Tax=Lentinula guzmanii TaxID=2804957 RepID=A0AA38MU06_9AGAR|nr:hypothetical protein DFJ43DRAFT_1044717 [Lentinula guzmanii]
MHILANDAKHWHNTRAILPVHLGGEKTKSLTEWEKRRRDRREHRAQTRLQRQAASLTGANGNMLNKITIAPVGSKAPPVRATGAEKTRANIQERKSKKTREADSKPIPLTGVQKARAKILEDKTKKTEKEATEWWEGKLKAMNHDTIEEQLKSIDFFKRNPSHKATYPSVAFEIRLYHLHLILKSWTMKPDPDVHRVDILVVKILCLLSEIKLLPVPTIPKTARKFLADVCLSIGFDTDTLLPNVDLSPESFAFKPIKLVSKNASLYPFMTIRLSPVEWQLEHFGEYMDRSMDSAPDTRVSFSPDRWQREVLDAIDENQSLLALAPTSAGKTFISFYAMEKVLRESDNGILVYVAPTKALVNQIAAEVYGRFSKNYSGSQTILAVYTRDTRVGDLQRAQILITVPEMLGILILSPTMAQNWTSRVKRIILDEIHSIGQEQGGAVWEQIILLAPCPDFSLIGTINSGLSATVGSPEQFNKWLESVQKAHCFSHVYIHHPHRYSHLRKYFFLPSPERSSFTSLSKHEISKRLTFLHPLSLLSDNSNSLPVDMALESRDCLSLYRTLRSHSLLEDDDLSPDVFFKSRGLLHKLNNLPAILFSLDRTNCEIMAKLLVERLERAETDWKQSDRSWKVKLAEVESWRKMDKVRSAQRQKEMKQKKDDDAPREDTSSHAWQATFNEEDPLADFSFAGRPSSIEELERVIQELSGPMLQTSDWAIRALRRGIAVHHAGTLALGINAPARTSVFCGDSPYLTALMCAGRAGRRGFDLLGNVVFYGLPYSRVQRLVLSRLPALGDSFPLTSTFILRLFNLLQGSNYADFAVKSVKSVMNLPRISHRSDMGRDQVLHHVRFSIEYLRRAGLLNHGGKPVNLFGIASHLYHTEPSNFAFVHLLESGVIHKICGQPSSVEAEKSLLILLCHLFGRRYIPRNYSQPEVIAKLQKIYPSLLILPPLPSNIGAQLQHHNKDILNMFSSYALSYAAEHQSSLGIDNVLPLSNGPLVNAVHSESPFIDHLNKTKITPTARSVFAATSGLDDHFTKANGIRRGDVWYELQEFHLTLKIIQTSLQELLIQLSLARNKEVKDANELLNLEAEDNHEDDVSEGDEDGIEGFKRPPKTSSNDWKVYEIFDLITHQEKPNRQNMTKYDKVCHILTDL